MTYVKHNLYIVFYFRVGF